MLKEKYEKEIVPSLIEKYHYKNKLEVPKLLKIVLNIGVGDASQNSKFMEAAVNDLSLISGQKPIITKAKKSVAAFKIREGHPIGCMTTLRGNNMYNFFEKLVNISLPQVRDFRGVSPKSFDKRGNYTLGIKEQLIFPEINFDEVIKIRGMDITIVTSAKTDDEARELLRALGMPFSGR